MFGYVAPQKCELKVRELTEYQAWYCGLCHALRREYGHMPRLALDYDCAFLALLLSGVEGDAPGMEIRRCALKPFKKRSPVARSSFGLSYAACCNVLLYYQKLRDDWADDKSAAGLIGGRLMRGAAQKAAKNAPEVAQRVEEGIAALSALEKAGECEIDRAADAFAAILKAVLGGYPRVSPRERETLGWLGYYLGRWIYFMDAWQDRDKDAKKGAYNPFLAAGADQQRASFVLYAALSDMEKAFDLLDIKAHNGLLDNIIYRGCRFKTQLLLEGLPDESI